ncbi:hypothetical protein [Halapricum hydrolyticum]|uniref:Uncharacterized protein n=1 Tax=Halapricum hydrolyticum TaxID=2979991 RepID=A0AAE3LE56_9EURY|nr:hypothetical protein [Halapricum hydrolyticum]MCU4716860.1 hypothetical protein [Halapricum hydrolyticum]MCU4725535.1 hypothetical protein [Halapricum hydrolyticum]
MSAPPEWIQQYSPDTYGEDDPADNPYTQNAMDVQQAREKREQMKLAGVVAGLIVLYWVVSR